MKLPEFCRRIVEASWFTGFIITVIVFAGILVGLETSASLMAEHGGLIGFLNNVGEWAGASGLARCGAVDGGAWGARAGRAAPGIARAPACSCRHSRLRS